MNDPNYLQIDATLCRKRFHCRLRPDQPKQPQVDVRCPECHCVVATFKDSHPIDFLRHENLINLDYPAKIQAPVCNFYKEPIR